MKRSTNLDFALLDGCILENPKVRSLLTLDEGEKPSCLNFSQLDLHGADLSNLNLEGINFTGANLSKVDFTKSILRGANFTNAKLFDANFSEAHLTSACIDDWAINNATCFDSVVCQYIYLKKTDYGFLDKKPDVGEFESGDFRKWIERLQNTIDFILKKQPNLKALVAAISVAAAESGDINPDKFTLESKGDNLFIARVGVHPGADKENLARNIIINYNSISGLELQGSGSQLVLNPLGSTMEAQSNDITIGGSVDASHGERINVTGDVVGASIVLGNLTGQVNNSIQNLRNTGEREKKKISDTLETLKESIQQDANLSDSQKSQALEALAMLGEEAQKPQERRITKLCNMAINSLKGISSTLSNTSELVKSLQVHLPTLVSLFSL